MSFHLSLKSPLKFLNFSVMNMHYPCHNLKITIKIITGGEEEGGGGVIVMMLAVARAGSLTVVTVAILVVIADGATDCR